MEKLVPNVEACSGSGANVVARVSDTLKCLEGQCGGEIADCPGLYGSGR